MSTAPDSAAFPERGHDHRRCVSEVMAEATDICSRRGARLTPLRRRVLEIIWRSHRPFGAYPILEILAVDGRSAAPPTVYRALDFLLENGLVHRIASLNAFVGCRYPGHVGAGQFLICQACGSAAELNDIRVERAIDKSAAASGFVARGHTVEISGLCPNCQ